MGNKPKIAVVLLNLGGPDKKESIAPFLKNFFMDRNIIRAPYPVRFILSRYIAWKRSRAEAGTSYGHLGYRSPLLENTEAQARALQSILDKESAAQYQTFIAMRYWHPMSDEVVAAVKAFNPERIILLPLYPQYSTTTTRSSLQEWAGAAKKAGLDVPTQIKCCYPFDAGFIAASAKNIVAKFNELKAMSGRVPRVLFSAHGLPEKIIAEGDPYQWQCEESARKIAAATGIDGLDWMICYQSRVGPLQWIKPSAEEALQKAAADQVPVLMYPHAFVSEHVETLVEIEIEYRHLAHELGIPAFDRVPTVGYAPEFIDGLAKLVIATGAGPALCPKEFGQCCRREFPDFCEA